MATKGVGIGAIAAGGVFLYAGVKGYSIPQTFQAIIQGKAPTGQQPVTPIGTPVSTAPASASSSGNLGTGSGAAIAADALRYKGTNYTWAGAPALHMTSAGIGDHDCSSLANWVIGFDLGLAIPFYKAGGYNGSTHGPPTTAWLVWTGCKTISHNANDAQPGDLAVWPTHMGICLGPNQMISAEDTANGTQVSGINGFIKEPLTIRRLKAVINESPNLGPVPPGKVAKL